MKSIICFSLLLLFIYSCSDSKKNSFEQDSVQNYKIKAPSGYTNEDYIASVLRVYSDSLNNYKQGDSLPDFLFSKDFEKKLKKEYWSLNNFLSIKEEIFKKITNKVVLDTLLTDLYFKDQYKKEKNKLYLVYTLANNRKKSLEDSTYLK